MVCGGPDIFVYQPCGTRDETLKVGLAENKSSFTRAEDESPVRERQADEILSGL